MSLLRELFQPPAVSLTLFVQPHGWFNQAMPEAAIPDVTRSCISLPGLVSLTDLVSRYPITLGILLLLMAISPCFPALLSTCFQACLSIGTSSHSLYLEQTGTSLLIPVSRYRIIPYLLDLSKLLTLQVISTPQGNPP